ncbi:hypothetical protein L1987_28892 [Smallanthus sonchifolius]|uniref:Uncharacterized protein n=1 Tax=Smallanthus sonchifolius TaxID=185202 RepID=A0ACB9HZ89_9ASTR|nr:hypothetical protein L1987_28892 [Smallanthus sonchifolius]
MEQQSIIQNNLTGVPTADFHDALEESSFLNLPNAFEESDQSVTTSEHDSNKSEESTFTFISEHTPDSPSSPSSAGLRHRRSCRESSQSQFFKNNPDGLIDFDPPVKKYARSSSSILKNNENVNENSNSSVFHRSSISDGRRLSDDTDASSSLISVDSPNSAPDLVSILLELAIKVSGFQTKFLANSVTFPIWLLHASYLIMTDPLGIIKLARSYMLGNSSGILGIFSLLVWAFVFGGVMMKRIVEEPVLITEKLVFDYTKDTPMAFVPVVSCPESSVVVHNQKSKFASLDESRVIPFDHEVHATVSLTLPESDYNVNLGIFQVRVDFISSDGKLLGSIRQPCMLKFRSQPIRLVSTFFKLASLLSGYSSETQTLDLKFRGYTEKDVHTSCSRVVIEQHAEFARRGGVPEIYSASLKIESQLPFVRRMLWYSKWLIYMWISIMVYIMELLFLLLCCRPVIFPWE